MATEQIARTDTVIVIVDNTELKLSVTTRAPKATQANPPTLSQLARIRTGCIMKYTTTWRKAVSGEYGIDDFDPELKSPIRIVSEDENETIAPSEHAPYVTIWQMGNWGTNQPPSLTLHDYDSGNDILQLNAVCEASNARLREIFSADIKGIRLVYLSSFVKTESPTQQNAPNNITRIGTNADNQPDTAQRNTVQTDVIPLRGFVRSTKAGQFAGSISIESGKTDAPNWKTQARLADKPYHAKEVQYPHGALVAYEISGLITVGEWEGQRTIDIPLKGGGSFRQFDDSTQQYPKWAELVKKMGIDDTMVTPGAKFQLRADYLVLKCESEDKSGAPLMNKKTTPPTPVQYKKFAGFYIVGSANPPAQDTAPDLSYFDTDESSDYQPDGEPFPF